MSRWMSVLPLLLLLGLAFYFAIGLQTDTRTIQSVLIDKPLPAFDLPKFGHEDERVKSSDFQGKVTLLNIFASWCITCRVEHPLLLKLRQDPQVRIYGLAWKDKPAELKDWLEELGDPYLAIADDAKGRTAFDLGVTGAPETYVIDKRGRIRYKQVGAIDDYIWEKQIAPMIAQLEAEP